MVDEDDSGKFKLERVLIILWLDSVEKLPSLRWWPHPQAQMCMADGENSQEARDRLPALD